MCHKVYILVFIFISIFNNLLSQTYFEGKVLDESSVPMPGVLVRTLDYNIKTETDGNGYFRLDSIPNDNKKIELEFSHIGYKRITAKVDLDSKKKFSIEMKLDVFQTDQIVITGSRTETYLKDSPLKIEVLTNKELCKIGSFNITQALEYTSGLKVQNNCGVCGTNDIRIQGLEGQYTQILINGAPIISNLGTVYGLQGFNTDDIEQIEIIKGPGSILYGPEALAGTINLILKDPADKPLFNADFTTSSFLENKFLLSFAKTLKNTKVSLNTEYNLFENRIDNNGDGYTDIPNYNRFILLNRWHLDPGKNFHIELTGRYLYEDRFGGQLNWDADKHRGGNVVYGESIYTNRQEFMAKIDKKINNDLRFESNISEFYHNQNSFYGTNSYNADQFSVYGDALLFWKNSVRSSFIFGAGYKFERYDDNTPATLSFADSTLNAPANYHIYSVFAQNEFSILQNLNTSIGLRYNYHNIQNSIWQPRFSIKYNPLDYTALRFSFGTGFRTVNIFSEDHGALTGTRQVVINGNLSPEKSINFSGSIIQDFDFGNQFMRLSIDVSYTRFSNQIIPDYDTDPNKIIYQNLNGFSISRGISAVAEYQFSFPMKFKVSYDFLESYKENTDGYRETLFFNPKHRINLDLSYNFRNINLDINLLGKYIGTQKLPLFENPVPRPTESTPYSIWNIQLRKTLGDFVLSAGIENIFNYKQDSPLIDPQNPFGNYFDTIYIYGPLEGRKFVFGFHFDIH